MELPAALRQAVDAQLQGVALADLQRASGILSRRYRAETRDGKWHLSDELAAHAYLAARLPATFAAVTSALQHAADIIPDFAPRSHLDIGAGPGTALWAASAVWTEIETSLLLEGSNAIRAVGEKLSAHAPVADVQWRAADVTTGLKDAKAAELVTLAYVLDELNEPARQQLIAQLWNLTEGMFVIVEPGTPAGWQRILDARAQLQALGAHIAAPCTHSQACAVQTPDWCHFSRRVARSKIHRLTKEADVPWEDEKFSYLAVSRQPVSLSGQRVLMQPKTGGGKVIAKLCSTDGQVAEHLITKRDKDLFGQARRADWGDLIGEE
ncbi:small ribosomal subunit Rsm22 family protein [Pseudochrobactrum lubricantis]|uniref:small ribosomal subunit Rsm22 family protein n=1 Tax=Pseudochrobactrum lubricantis TaxID=558172 RepID=UPI0035DAB1F7